MDQDQSITDREGPDELSAEDAEFFRCFFEPTDEATLSDALRIELGQARDRIEELEGSSRRRRTLRLGSRNWKPKPNLLTHFNGRYGDWNAILNAPAEPRLSYARATLNGRASFKPSDRHDNRPSFEQKSASPRLASGSRRTRL
jgi:hypothetical protein